MAEVEPKLLDKVSPRKMICVSQTPYIVVTEKSVGEIVWIDEGEPFMGLTARSALLNRVFHVGFELVEGVLIIHKISCRHFSNLYRLINHEEGVTTHQPTEGASRYSIALGKGIKING